MLLDCQWPMVSARRWLPELPVHGHQNCPLVAMWSARPDLEWRHPLSVGCLGKSDRVAGGNNEVGAVIVAT